MTEKCMVLEKRTPEERKAYIEGALMAFKLASRNLGEDETLKLFVKQLELDYESLGGTIVH